MDVSISKTLQRFLATFQMSIPVASPTAHPPSSQPRSNPVLRSLDLAAHILIVTDYDDEDLRVAAGCLSVVFNRFDGTGCSNLFLDK
jgi:hypothetical protein